MSTASSASATTLWLLRRTKGEILGPMSLGELKKMFMSGGLPSDSEFCPENGYWFSFQEIEELKKYFTPQEITAALRPIEKSQSPVEESTQSDMTKPDTMRPDAKIDAHHREQASDEQSSSSHRGSIPEEVSKSVFIEQGQFFGIVFFVGVIGAIFAVIWLIHKLNVSA